jgi:hypothetical protein
MSVCMCLQHYSLVIFINNADKSSESFQLSRIMIYVWYINISVWDVLNTYCSVVLLCELWHIFLYSLAVEPLYPQVCQKVAVYRETTSDQGPSPVELSRSLNSIACSISFRREDPISIFHLIMQVSYVLESSKFWEILACSPLKGSQHFRGTCHLSLRGQ